MATHTREQIAMVIDKIYSWPLQVLTFSHVMSLTIKEVTDKKGLAAFLDYPYRLYKNHPYFVPPCASMRKRRCVRTRIRLSTIARARYWLAYKDNVVVGRVAAILNHAYIDKWKTSTSVLDGLILKMTRNSSWPHGEGRRMGQREGYDRCAWPAWVHGP